MIKSLANISLSLTLTISATFSSARASEPSQDNTPLIRIACGSCFKPNYKSAPNIWPVIAATKPQLFLFMGDCIYADTHDMKVMQAKYKALADLPAYAKFSKKHKIIPIWDDHDYGINDAGNEYQEKIESQKIFLDSHNFPTDHPARSRKGIYHSHTQGPKGKITQIINLDTRYHRSPLDKRKIAKRQTYFPVTDPKATILGAQQWAWLEAQLNKPADLRIIVSSIQIISAEHRFEKWQNIPTERKRLIQLLKKSNTKRVLILSGDRHMAEISKLTPEETGLNFDLLELTSSGLTHAYAPKSPNKHQLPGSFVNIINFGSLDIDWSNKIPTVTLNIHDRDGKKIFHTETAFKE